jgi:NADPH2:quinone reductase
MDVKAAAAAPVGLGTAHLALFELARLQAGETVLVQGAAGGVGLAAVQLAKRAGALVIGTGSSAAQLDALRPYGLDHGVVYGREDMVAAVRELTGKKGVEVAVDPIGGATLAKTVDCLGFGGRAVLVGLLDQSQPSVIDARLLLMNGKSLIGGMLGTIMHTPRVGAFIQELLARVHSGELKVAIDRVFPLAEAAEAHRYAETRGRSIGRVVITP